MSGGIPKNPWNPHMVSVREKLAAIFASTAMWLPAPVLERRAGTNARRWLNKMHAEGLIERRQDPDGQRLWQYRRKP